MFHGHLYPEPFGRFCERSLRFVPGNRSWWQILHREYLNQFSIEEFFVWAEELPSPISGSPKIGIKVRLIPTWRFRRPRKKLHRYFTGRKNGPNRSTRTKPVRTGSNLIALPSRNFASSGSSHSPKFGINRNEFRSKPETAITGSVPETVNTVPRGTTSSQFRRR